MMIEEFEEEVVSDAAFPMKIEAFLNTHGIITIQYL